MDAEDKRSTPGAVAARGQVAGPRFKGGKEKRSAGTFPHQERSAGSPRAGRVAAPPAPTGCRANAGRGSSRSSGAASAKAARTSPSSRRGGSAHGIGFATRARGGGRRYRGRSRNTAVSHAARRRSSVPSKSPSMIHRSPSTRRRTVSTCSCKGGSTQRGRKYSASRWINGSPARSAGADGQDPSHGDLAVPQGATSTTAQAERSRGGGVRREEALRVRAFYRPARSCFRRRATCCRALAT